ncbi:MAG: DUF6130 family protein [Chitinophagaceae bacterium]
MISGIQTPSGNITPPGRAVREAASVVPLNSEPKPVMVVDPPLPDQLAMGRVVIQYRMENVHIAPVYGPAALDVSPRLGHLHLTVDHTSWHWVDASGEPIILNGLTPGEHHILIELADPTHRIIDSKEVSFDIPAPP